MLFRSEADTAVQRLVGSISDPGAAAELRAERAVVEALGGGCQTPIGALATSGSAGDIELVAVVISLDGSRALSGHARGPRADAAAIGARVGAQLLADGAGDILADARHAAGAAEGIQR